MTVGYRRYSLLEENTKSHVMLSPNSASNLRWLLAAENHGIYKLAPWNLEFDAAENRGVRHRMCGHRVCWVPGIDHAGIATQALLERVQLSPGSNFRDARSRDDRMKMAHEWRKQKQNNIEKQLKRLGGSLDFSRTRFTMDEKMTAAVKEAFVRLFDKGFIYRDKKIVNWSYSLRTTISDMEVKHVDIPPGGDIAVPDCTHKIEVGYLERILYPVDNTEVEVCTTRLESILADTALAVHPQDSRYTCLVGRVAVHPITGRRLPIIADSAVDRDFGTGVLKLTPGHCKLDNVLAQKHNIPVVECFDENGRVMQNFSDFAKSTRWEAREMLRSRLSDLGFYRGRQAHGLTLPVCSRSGDILDSRLHPQFFLRCSHMAQRALEAATSGSLEFVPEYFKKVWVEWLSRPEDWCISRQLWWGHQIPAYRVLNSLEEMWVSGRDIDEATARAAQQLGIAEKEVCLEQDKDVLDTWFSSALFPFSVFGWPEQTESLRAYYPLSLMETGHDILFFWVAHMVMLGHELTGQLPFRKILLHGLIRDSQGRKMSKSLGNVIDPLHVIEGAPLKELHEICEKMEEQGYLTKDELYSAIQCQRKMFPQGIPQCGADSLRMALLSRGVKAENIAFSINDAVRHLRFCNKVWQAVRFFLSAAEKFSEASEGTLIFDIGNISQVNLSTIDRWILSCLAYTVGSCNEHLEHGDLHQYVSSAQQFFVQKFCDVYLESVKPTVWSSDRKHLIPTCNVMAIVVQTAIRLLAPVTPHLAEELHQRLAVRFRVLHPQSICVTPYPEPQQWQQWKNAELVHDVARVLEVVSSLRSVKKSCGVNRPTAYVVVKEDGDKAKLEELSPTVQHLSWMGDLQVVAYPDWNGPPAEGTWSPATVNSSIDIYVETDIAKLREVTSERIRRLAAKLHKLEAKVSNQQYIKRMSKVEKEKHEQEMSELRLELEKLQGQKLEMQGGHNLICTLYSPLQ
ncbi:valine--tRNA ligase, mitochondrial-like isoform X2 [Ornithodoros turicata]|uniref:valine--tRNA ligase, mitochondrial-like isoform X2 n=1 Tax=Ornithodoros turicata TaxID=34597 RepID=UPI0031386A8F